MKQVKLIGAFSKEEDLVELINEELSKWNSDNTEVQFRMCMNENEVLYSALIIIKDCI